MKTKVLYIVFVIIILIVSCTRNQKQTLTDDQVHQDNNEYVQLEVILSPPPPGRIDVNDTTSVIEETKISKSNIIFEATEVDFLPSFPNGGWGAFANYLHAISYPAEIKESDIANYITIIFIVERNGTITNIEIANSDNELVNKSVTNALQNMPVWKPGKKDGMYVRSKYGVTIVYK